MEGLLEEAKKHEIKEVHERQYTPKILVIGAGGAGNNSINRLHKMDIRGARTLAINTDSLHLEAIEVPNKLLVGADITKGLGAGGVPEVGKKCAESSKGDIKRAIGQNDLVFLTAGMGGGTGTGTSPVIAKIAAEEGAMVVGIVSTPFNVERKRVQIAEKGIQELSRYANTVIILENEKLLKFCPDLPIDQAFGVMDEIICQSVKGLSETITQPSLINLDFADVKTIMKAGGTSCMLWGEAVRNGNTAIVKRVVDAALNRPLLEIDQKEATGALVHITGGPEMTLDEVHKITAGVTEGVSINGNVIFGARVVPEMDGKIKVMAIITGVHSPNIVGPTSKSRFVDFSPQITETVDWIR